MDGREAFVKIAGLLVLGGIASKVITVIAPRSAAAIPTSRAVVDAVVDAAAPAGRRAAKAVAG